MSSHIELCQFHHIHDMVSLYNASFVQQWKPEDFHDFVLTDPIDSRERNYNPKKAWGLFLNTLMLGFVLGQCVEDECELVSICIHKKYRQQGYASQLLTHILNLPYSLYTLEVNEKNRAAIGLYQRHGFQKIGLRPHYYRRDEGKFDNAFICQYSKK